MPNLGCAIDDSAINVLTPLLSMFLHGSWGHLLGNAIYFWVFGNNVEDSMGRFRFLVFYLICGLAAAATHVMVDPRSPVPTVGASGAISGILGAYLVLYPRVRVRYFVFLFFVRFPAWVALLWWFATQVLTGVTSAQPGEPGGVRRRGGLGARGRIRRWGAAREAVRESRARVEADDGVGCSRGMAVAAWVAAQSSVAAPSGRPMFPRVQIARVIGRVVSTVKQDTLSAVTLQWIQPITTAGTDAGKPLVAVDRIGVGPGEIIYFITSREAALTLDNPFAAVDAGIVGKVDWVDIEGRQVLRADDTDRNTAAGDPAAT